MHKKFDHKAIEKKWQERWTADKIYRTSDASDKPKTFVLDMFPYPSGEGLHVGHPKGYIATDIYSRMKRMNGHEVLHPMGWDAFGLPAENFAIKHKVHPRVAVDKNISNFKSQLAKLGFDYDWEREINTTDPGYYKWTQWIFIQLLKKGLAYESNEPINWCSGCQTGLANEDLNADGTCERCDSVVEKKPMRQWVLKIREYADRMLADLDTLEWPEHIKEAQRNWIGKSEGVEIDFTLSTGDTVTVFTTRPDTLFGATYMVLAPEHPLVAANLDKIFNRSEVEDYIAEAAKKAEQDRLDGSKEKTGVKLEGITVTNPGSGEQIPVFIADYVLAGYGTGAIMAVPAHDDRDGEFAKKFGLQIKTVVVEDKIMFAGALLESKQNPGKYILQLRPDDFRTFPGQIAFFGGRVEDGESAHECIIREIEEELEIRLSEDQLLESYSFLGEPNNTPMVTAIVKGIDEDKLVCHEGEIVSLSLDEIGTDNRVMGTVKKFVEDHILASKFDTRKGVLVNSGDFDGMSSEEAKVAITEKVGGRMTSTYKIKDWVFSRQRYWGEPIPVVRTESGEVYPIAEAQLPVTLPEVEHYEPAGDGRSPLATITDWVNVTGYVTDDGDFMVADEAPTGKELVKAERETNTMPQWAGSSWYYLRYMDPQNEQALVGDTNEQKWAPVDVYVGGDHAVRHLIYARFWHKFLYDIGVVSTIEPFQRLEFLGFILAEDGRKMSKRWGNVINPDDVVARVGADTLRVYEMFMGPFENTIAWSQDGLAGACRFLERVNGLKEHIADSEPQTVTKQLHKTILKVSDDIEAFKFNTAVSAMMIFVNIAEKEGLTKATYETFLQLLAPFAPHLTEELWVAAGHTTSIHVSEWPAADAELAKDDLVTIGVQINGKVRGEITIAPDATEADALAAVGENTDLQARLTSEIKKVIYREGKILNLILAE